MIELTQGNILKSKADVLVNTVNCVGVMGKGIALQFKKAYPEVFKAYASACDRGDMRIGHVQIYDLNRLSPPHYIINFPTKNHWRGKSKIEYIQSGLYSLADALAKLEATSVAVPPLGCGHGGLSWEDVFPLIESALGNIPGLDVYVFEPKGAPSAAEMAKDDRTPRMTEGRALLLSLMRRYLSAIMDPDISLLEIHKLMYFMQESGQDLRLIFSKGPYGPYGNNLRHVLTHIEGHFILGFGDASENPDVSITPFKSAMIDAENYLSGSYETMSRLKQVSELISGFETPFGMELLSTVHWLAVHDGVKSHDDARKQAYSWNSRKRMFTEDDIDLAWNVLQTEGWID